MSRTALGAAVSFSPLAPYPLEKKTNNNAPGFKNHKTPHAVGLSVFISSGGATLRCETSCTKHCTSVHTWQRARVATQRSGKLLEIVAESRTCSTFRNGFCNLSGNVFGCCKVRDTVQCIVPLVSLRDKLHETLRGVTTP